MTRGLEKQGITHDRESETLQDQDKLETNEKKAKVY